MLRVADVLTEIRDADEFGITVAEPEVDFAAVIARREKVVKTLTGGVAGLFKKNKIDVIEGHGARHRRRATSRSAATSTAPRSRRPRRHPRHRLGQEADPGHAVRRPRDRHRGGVGARPSCPRRWPSSAPARRAPRSPRPTRASAREVMLFEALDRVLPTEDADISKLAERGFKKQGIDVHTGDVRRERRDQRRRACTFTYGDEAGEADWLVIAAGRGPDVEGLGLEEAGVKLDEQRPDRGRRRAAHVASTGVCAIGDLVPGPALAHKASDEGIIAVEDAAGLRDPPDRLHRHPARDVLHAQRRAASASPRRRRARPATTSSSARSSTARSAPARSTATARPGQDRRRQAATASCSAATSSAPRRPS